MSTRRLFAKYVSQNIFGLIGNSLYILADTFFISVAEGANGITALNLVLPIYSFIFAVGSMIGVGSAIRFKILRAQNKSDAEFYFSNAVFFTAILGMIGLGLGLTMPDKIVSIMGGDSSILPVAVPYTRIFMIFTPFFMLNYVFQAFIRNDGAPSLAMAATLSSSLLNIVMDYLLMFPMKMGMAGAALATGISPIIGMLVCSMHFFTKENTISFCKKLPSIRRLFRACKLGVSAFVGEISSGVTTAVFNMVILRLAGNIGVAAYGVVANTALVAVSVFNGVAQGSQPLLSDYYGRGDSHAVKKVLRYSIGTAACLAFFMIAAIWVWAPQVTAFFNSEHSAELARYAVYGIRLYFIGFLFAGFNIVGTGYLSATESAGWAFAASIMRGFIAIVSCAILLSLLLGMTGVWIAFPAAEFLTALITLTAILKNRSKNMLKITDK